MENTPAEKMASTTEKPAEPYTSDVAQDEVTSRATGKPWMYKRLKLGPITLPAYASPPFQVVFVAMVCFLCPGMFNAVNGLGAAGGLDATSANNANTALYATFSVVGFFAGSIANRIGLRLTLGFGGFGYCLYIIAIVVYNHTGNSGFFIFSGALLGCCAGLLWTAQGAIMMAYPSEEYKGRYISAFWMIFNLGGVLGSLIPLGQTISNTAAKSVNDGTYVAFIILMALGFFLATGLCNPRYVRRSDGSHIIMMKNPTWKSEIMGLFQVLYTDWYIIFLLPMFLSSNWFYTYHFQDVNLAKFNIRTRSLNGVLYWFSQIVGAFVMGFVLDMKIFKRKQRARVVMGILLTLTMVIWGGGYAFQKQYTREEAAAPDFVLLDWTSNGYIGPMFLYMFYGFYDAAWQTSVYWLMGSLTNNSRKLANFTGIYKSIQSAGAAITPVIDNAGTPYMTEFASTWGLLVGSLLVAAPVIWLKVQDHTNLEDDLAFSDETVADIAPAAEFEHTPHVNEKM